MYCENTQKIFEKNWNVFRIKNAVFSECRGKKWLYKRRVLGTPNFYIKQIMSIRDNGVVLFFSLILKKLGNLKKKQQKIDKNYIFIKLVTFF